MTQSCVGGNDTVVQIEKEETGQETKKTEAWKTVSLLKKLRESELGDAKKQLGRLPATPCHPTGQSCVQDSVPG